MSISLVSAVAMLIRALSTVIANYKWQCYCRACIKRPNHVCESPWKVTSKYVCPLQVQMQLIINKLKISIAISVLIFYFYQFLFYGISIPILNRIIIYSIYCSYYNCSYLCYATSQTTSQTVIVLFTDIIFMFTFTHRWQKQDKRKSYLQTKKDPVQISVEGVDEAARKVLRHLVTNC